MPLFQRLPLNLANYGLLDKDESRRLRHLIPRPVERRENTMRYIPRLITSELLLSVALVFAQSSRELNFGENEGSRSETARGPGNQGVGEGRGGGRKCSGSGSTHCGARATQPIQ